MHTIHDIGQTLLAGTIISSDLTGRVKQPSGQRTAKQSKGEFLGKHKAEGGGGEGIEEEDKKKKYKKKEKKGKEKEASNMADRLLPPICSRYNRWKSSPTRNTME